MITELAIIIPIINICIAFYWSIKTTRKCHETFDDRFEQIGIHKSYSPLNRNLLVVFLSGPVLFNGIIPMILNNNNNDIQTLLVVIIINGLVLLLNYHFKSSKAIEKYYIMTEFGLEFEFINESIERRKIKFLGN